MQSMLLMPLMRSTPPFWMPDLQGRSSRERPSVGTIAIPRCARDDNLPSLRSRWQPPVAALGM